MKKLLFNFFCLGLLFGCQETISVDLPTEEPRLILDAIIRVNDPTQVVSAIDVKASLSSSFFEENVPANLTEIRLTNNSSQNLVVLTQEEEDSGVYSGLWSTNELINGDITLTAVYNGEIYTAETSYVPSTPILNVAQGDKTLFEGNETEIVITFEDRKGSDDFYLFDLDFSQFLVSEDTFYKDQAFTFSYFYDNNLSAGREINITLLGVNESFYNYMNLLILQSSGGDQGPFQTPSTTARGNFINTSNNANFALGYFAICQTYSGSIVIE